MLNVNVDPAQIGPLFDAVGVAGIALTVAVVDPAGLVHPFTVIVTLYVPVAAVVAFVIVGFCKADVNPFGPVQLYVAPATVEVLNVNVDPAQIGPSFDAVGVAGIASTVAVVDPAALVHPFTVTNTEYAPLAAVVAFAIDGF